MGHIRSLFQTSVNDRALLNRHSQQATSGFLVDRNLTCTNVIHYGTQSPEGIALVQFKIGECVVMVEHGDITQVQVDAIVNPANSRRLEPYGPS